MAMLVPPMGRPASVTAQAAPAVYAAQPVTEPGASVRRGIVAGASGA